ncbi:tRNA epoxyqueuosine(34) reductase QueG [Anoxynatronum buryatiense]|uniref:Epoxyqueuosine reductase n=1 Tax=Anoxynatronum buryatiense TaxID=489973 RepID=A0AA45WTH0_9CLOT|nr:tRNA epoxyqueuosine(34) reductase QueG [Anoxynatronum buryatiense]SMP39171.1 epoxyqueuosine reductase [Anoxynatronum buryatiense]
MITMEQLRSLAESLHIDGIGALKARVFHELTPILEKRLQEHRVTAFEESDLALRIDPFQIMAEAETIVIIATSYYLNTKEDQGETLPLSGKLARFAWGLDYHQILHQQLRMMGEALQKLESGLLYQAFVDTGPLVERYLAVQASMGAYGRHNCLIVPGVGSYVVLGGLLINKPVAGSQQTTLPLTSCEGCGRCQRACPSQALEKPGQIDPRRCLSHLLQQKETIPREMRHLMENRLYGCDICQEACPHNRKPASASHPEMIASVTQRCLDLPHLLSLSNRQFNRLYRTTAFGWRGQKVMQRNALMALGNSHDQSALPVIQPFLQHPRKELQEMAKWASNHLLNDN